MPIFDDSSEIRKIRAWSGDPPWMIPPGAVSLLVCAAGDASFLVSPEGRTVLVVVSYCASTVGDGFCGAGNERHG
ncbi:hypothetical protein CCHOA_11315 [Corynebacterium choanae]|uniref:Uncharacterized protein n=1 Tax=Corynebacterium choanae TaxID=1862358 RepID=A0A3G6JES0_9CORY|nr:hypothetical protein CCHOA_11315 [Corynebacterium choanae]